MKISYVGADDFVSLLNYEGNVRDSIVGIKYKNNRRPIKLFAYNLALELSRLVSSSTLITWLPTTTEHVAERGFDHAELLSGALSRYLGCASEAVFAARVGGPQTKKSRELRMHNVRFVVGEPSRLRDKHVVLVDDVVTTGATASAGIRALRAAGVKRVSLAVVAATPRYFAA